MTSPSGPANPMDDPSFVAGLRAVPSGAPGEAPVWPAVDLHGVRPDGTPVTVSLDPGGPPVLLCFLSLECDGCDAFWTGLADGTDPVLARVRPVVVTKGPDVLDPAAVATRSAGFGGDVVMGASAWDAYRVTGYPFLVLVDPVARRVLAESVGFGWTDVATVVADGLGPA